MTLKADGVDVGAVEKAWIGSAVGRMATDTTFGLDYAMFVAPGPRGFGVALDAGSVLPVDRFKRSAFKGAMRVVTVRALDETFIDLMVIRQGEVEAGIVVALITQCGLRCLEQVVGFALMDVVTAEATYVAIGMCRAIEIRMTVLMTVEAKSVDIVGGRGGWIEDLRFVSVAVDVGLAVAVAAFACDCVATVGRGQASVGIVCESLDHFFMTASAHAGADDVLSRVWRGLGSGAFY